MTPSRITRLDGYGSPLRGAPGNGPPRGGRHQPLLSRLPTVFVNYTTFFVSLLPFTSSSVMIVVLGLFSSHATTATRRRNSRRSFAVGLKRRTSRSPLSRPTSTRLTTKPPRPVFARLPSSSQSSARSIARPASRAHTPCFTTAAVLPPGRLFCCSLST